MSEYKHSYIMQWNRYFLNVWHGVSTFFALDVWKKRMFSQYGKPSIYFTSNTKFTYWVAEGFKLQLNLKRGKLTPKTNEKKCPSKALTAVVQVKHKIFCSKGVVARSSFMMILMESFSLSITNTPLYLFSFTIWIEKILASGNRSSQKSLT